MTSTGLFGGGAAHLGKSARTRPKLMGAAARLFARSGAEAAAVHERAQPADVANGTFYVHFRDKDAIGAEVALAIAQNVTRQLDEAMAGVDDAIERTSMATRRFIDLAASEPDWGHALLRALWTFRGLRESVVGHLRADLQRGVDQGVFDVEVDDMLIDTFGSMVMGGLLARLAGESGTEAGARVAELQLRMLGVPAARAKSAAWRTLEPLTLPL